jgi:hypothetical protein
MLSGKGNFHEKILDRIIAIKVVAHICAYDMRCEISQINSRSVKLELLICVDQ